MSWLFESRGDVVWDVATQVARLFVAEATAVAEWIEVPAGLDIRGDDTCQIDIEQFQKFTESIASRYLSSSHPGLRMLIFGVVLPSLVILERSGIQIAFDSSAGGQLIAQAREHARSMGR
ncbi:hypothetical protein F1D05_05630 [Kribbella qitaiheensis]|uniref:Uncharacterized protein n=1 Tax=Kribbella qitaiheensis TaxID=1544730 RepID=A0A7G6WU19_9ACTN|nr:DUF6086 family protein [Kribbella qitaiheensis]QNE17484.1 hypothetical protein F1D05_05630 [Kribbella qitaiheensis]